MCVRQVHHRGSVPETQVIRYYHAFLTFFTERVKESGASETIESYVFSPAVNTDGVQMMTRFMSGV